MDGLATGIDGGYSGRSKNHQFFLANLLEVFEEEGFAGTRLTGQIKVVIGGLCDGEGLHEESSSNIGTMQHLKNVLMGVK